MRQYSISPSRQSYLTNGLESVPNKAVRLIRGNYSSESRASQSKVLSILTTLDTHRILCVVVVVSTSIPTCKRSRSPIYCKRPSYVYPRHDHSADVEEPLFGHIQLLILPSVYQ